MHTQFPPSFSVTQLETNLRIGYLSFLLFLSIGARLPAVAQPDSTANRSDGAADSTPSGMTGPLFRSFQVDATTLLLSSAVSGSIDIDALRWPESDAGIGIRVGIESFQGGIIAPPHTNSNSGADNLLYNLLGRLTSAPKPFRLDLLAGVAAREANSSSTDGSALVWEPKIGAEIRWMFIEHYAGLLLKANTTLKGGSYGRGIVGLGIVIGYQP